MQNAAIYLLICAMLGAHHSSAPAAVLSTGGFPRGLQGAAFFANKLRGSYTLLLGYRVISNHWTSCPEYLEVSKPGR